MPGSGSHACPAPRRVLIVEDNELHEKLLRDILKFYGYATLATASGGSAIEIARQNRPDLILLDMRLPDVDGTELAGRLKADPQTRATPIIAVTAYAIRGDRERCIDSGCDDYIAKPISIDGIMALVERYTTPPPNAPPPGGHPPDTHPPGDQPSR